MNKVRAITLQLKCAFLFTGWNGTNGFNLQNGFFATGKVVHSLEIWSHLIIGGWFKFRGFGAFIAKRAKALSHFKICWRIYSCLCFRQHFIRRSTQRWQNCWSTLLDLIQLTMRVLWRWENSNEKSFRLQFLFLNNPLISLFLRHLCLSVSHHCGNVKIILHTVGSCTTSGPTLKFWTRSANQKGWIRLHSVHMLVKLEKRCI